MEQSMLQKSIRYLFNFFLSIIALWSCGDKMQSNKELQQAFEFHREAVKVRQTAEEKMAPLLANKDSMFIAAYGEELLTISRSLNAWDGQLVEVPGFEEVQHHTDHEHSNHDHHHGQTPELTPEEQIGVQRYLLNEIKLIVKRIDNIKE